MIAAARILPLRPHRAQRLPRRFPSTLRSIPTREASGAPAPAAPPPSSAGAPPAASAPPAAAPPPPPVPESGERERPAVDPLALLLGQLAAIIGAHRPAVAESDAVSAVLLMLNATVALITRHLANPTRPLHYGSVNDANGAFVSLFLDIREGSDQANQANEADDQEEKRPEQLPEELAFVANHLAWVLGDFDAARENARSIQGALKDPANNLRLLTDEARSLVAALNSMGDDLRQIAGRLGGMDNGASIATHASRLARLAGYSDPDSERRCIVAEALDAWSE